MLCVSSLHKPDLVQVFTLKLPPMKQEMRTFWVKGLTANEGSQAKPFFSYCIYINGQLQHSTDPILDRIEGKKALREQCIKK